MSYENEVRKTVINDAEKFKETRLSIPIIKYFWSSSPLSRNRKKSFHFFLRNITILDKFSDFELRLFSNYLHLREFTAGEEIFHKGDRGLGFYFILKGSVEIYTEKKDSSEIVVEDKIVTLSKYQFFGELSLLDDDDVRNASARTKKGTTLLALFRPDLDELTERYPVVSAKLLRAISLIITKRFHSIASEVQTLRDKLKKLDSHESETN